MNELHVVPVNTQKVLSSYEWYGVDENIRPYNYRCPRQSLGVLLPAIKYGINA